MNIKFIKKFTYLMRIAVVSSLWLLASCSMGTLSNEWQVNGTFQQERFYDKSNCFNVKVPESYRYLMQDPNSPTVSCAVFQDITGNLHRYEVFPIPEDMKRIKTELLLQEIFEIQSAQLKQCFVDTSIIQQNYLPEHAAYFGILSIPGGSSLIDLETKKCLDSKRGYLLFFEGDYLIVLSNQVNPMTYGRELPHGGSITSIQIKNRVDQLDKLLLQDLLEMQKDFRLTSIES